VHALAACTTKEADKTIHMLHRTAQERYEKLKKTFTRLME
jgi:hypothetical protein